MSLTCGCQTVVHLIVSSMFKYRINNFHHECFVIRVHRDLWSVDLDDDCFLEMESVPYHSGQGPPPPVADKFSVHMVVRAPGDRAFSGTQDVGAAVGLLRFVRFCHI